MRPEMSPEMSEVSRPSRATRDRFEESPATPAFQHLTDLSLRTGSPT